MGKNMLTESIRVAKSVVAAREQGRSMKCPFCAANGKRVLSAPDRFHGRNILYHLNHCPVCDCTWLSDPPPPDQMSMHYTHEYHATISTAGETHALARWRVQRDLILQRRQSGSILDIGCSTGAFLSTLDRQAWKRYGIEMEASTAERARANAGAEVFVGDALDAPFAPESFDVITCFDLVEHLYNPKELLEKTFSWLKPGGIIYIGVPNIASWEARMFGSYWYGLELPRHFFHYSPKALRYLMRSIGFEERFLATRACYVERSVGYLFHTAIHRLGAKMNPASTPRSPGLLWKAARKLMRLAFVAPYGAIAASVGAGASVEAIFTKASPRQ